MSWYHSSLAADVELDCPYCRLLLFALAESANRETGQTYLSQGRLARIACCSERTTRRHLSDLKEAGLLSWVSRGRGSGGRDSNLYTLHLESKPDSLAGLPSDEGGKPDTSDRFKPDTAVSGEPSVEPSRERGRAREAEKEPESHEDRWEREAAELVESVTIPEEILLGDAATEEDLEAMREEGCAPDLEPFLDALRRWVVHRRRLKKPATKSMVEANLRRFVSWGEARGWSPNVVGLAAMEVGISRGWQGLFSPVDTDRKESEHAADLRAAEKALNPRSWSQRLERERILMS